MLGGEWFSELLEREPRDFPHAESGAVNVQAQLCRDALEGAGCFGPVAKLRAREFNSLYLSIGMLDYKGKRCRLHGVGAGGE